MMRALRELFGYRPMRHGVRFQRGRYEKLDFVSRGAAADWAKAHLFDDFVVFDYEPLELAIQPSKVRRDEHLTPDAS